MWERALLLNKRSRGGMSNTGGGGAAARKGKGADGAKPLSALYSGWGTYRQIQIGAGFKLKNKNGPFSAVSTPLIGRVGAFFNIFRGLQD